MREHPLIREVREWRRLRAVALHEEGWPEVLIAEALDVYKGTVSRWLAIAKASGIEALLAHTGAGHPPQLTLEQLAIVPELLWHGAETYGFRGDVWTCPRIAQVIHWELGLSYHKDHVSRLMKELGWTPQIPITRAIQRDEEVIERWRVEVWPELRQKAVHERRILFFVDESAFYLLPGKVKTYRLKGKSLVADPRSSIGDGRLYASRQGIYSGSTGIVVKHAQLCISGTSAASDEETIVGHLRRFSPFIAGKLCVNDWPAAERGGFTWNSCLAMRLTSTHWMQEAGIT